MRQRIDAFLYMWSRRRIGVKILALFMASLFVVTVIPVSALAEGEAPRPTYCGIEEHTHGDECYEERLICGKEEGEGGHTHTDACYEEHDEIVCGLQEGEGAHTHTDACYTEPGTLICGKAEGEGAHTHTDACYEEQEKLICTQPEKPAHHHSDACYEERDKLVCTQPEVPAHTHTDACYEEREKLTCTQPEVPAHHHSDACYETRKKLTCTEDHEHTDACYETETVLICGQQETAGHTHGPECYTRERVLACGQQETAGHTHGPECYTRERVLACGQEETEGHTHGPECYTREQVLVCGQEENPGHVHTDACYQQERALTCGKEENPGHVHTEACHGVVRELVCGQEENPGHVHTEACYEKVLVCTKEEHTHTLACYADVTADLEDLNTMLKSVAPAYGRSGELLTGNWALDLVAIAKTQVGYKQSEKNYIVDETGRKKYYTRYGQWAFNGDNSYIDWCAAFVSFCATFAKIPVDAFPTSTGCQRFVDRLQQGDLYRLPGAYQPKAGDIIFFRSSDRSALATHVGIVVSVSDQEIKTIEGNRTNKVDYFTYSPDDPLILGFGELPQNPELLPAEPEASAEASATPAVPAEPGEEPENPAEPGEEPEKPAEPDEEPEVPTEPGEEPENPAEPGEEPEKPAEPGEEPEVPTEPGEEPEVPSEPGEEPEVPADPQLKVHAQTLTPKLSGTTAITLSGVLPVGVSAAAKPATIAENALPEGEALLAYDLALKLKGAAFQPQGPVAVTISDPAIAQAVEEGYILSVYRLDEGGAVQVDCQAEGGVLTFSADSFGTYAVTKTVRVTTLTATDGEAYRIAVTYDNLTGVPADAQLVVSELPEGSADYDSYIRQTADLLATEVEHFAIARAFDIALVNEKTGEHYQPAKPVRLSIALLSETVRPSDSVHVVHFNSAPAQTAKSAMTKRGTLRSVAAAAPNAQVMEAELVDGAVELETQGFSIYVVVEEEEGPFVNYRFWWAEGDINSNDPLSPQPYRIISLKNEEQLLAPADPQDEARGKFQGWYKRVDGVETSFSCAGETASIADDAPADENVDIYAKFDNAKYAVFQSLYIDMERVVFHTQKLTVDGNTYSVDLNDVPTYGAPVGYKFLGWTTTQPTDPLGYGENIPKANYYAPDATVTGLTENTVFYPVCKKMYEVSFNGNGGRVNGLPVLKVQVTQDDTWEEVLSKITSVTRSGHTRDGVWFDGPDASAHAVTLSGATGLTADVTYYAHWTAATTTVTVKYWKQAVNASDPYSLIDQDTFTIDTGSTVELGKEQGGSVTRTHVLFHDPDDASQDSELDIPTVVSRIRAGGAKLGNGGGNYAQDTELKYFYIDSISAADPDGVRHSSSPTADRDFIVAEDGSTVVNVWINRTTYSIKFLFKLAGGLGNIYYGTSRINREFGPYTIKLGQDVSSIWPDLTDDDLSVVFVTLGYTPVALGVRTNESSYPNAVTSIFTVPLSVATATLLDLANGNNIELYGRYNTNNINGGIRTGTIYEYRQRVDGTYVRSNAIRYNFARGTNQATLEPFTSTIYPGYVLNVSQTLNANPNVYRKTDNGDGTVTIIYTRNGTYQANLYYDLDTYTVNLQYGDTILASGTDIKYTQPIKAYLQSSSTTSAIFADPTQAAGVPDYMVFGGWYTDQEFSTNYDLKDTNTMPATNVSIYAKFSPKSITVKVDNGIEDGTRTITDPQLNLSGSEMGRSVRYLDYQHEYGSDPAVAYKAHEHTIAEFLPTFWVNPVWEDHVFTGWKIREKDSAGNWGPWENLTDVNVSVDHDIELEAHWQDMARHYIHYIEQGREVYLDPEAYVHGKTVVVKGTDTEIYHKDTGVTEVFRYWLAEDGTTQYKPGDEITMGDDDITLTAVFAPGGVNTGSEKATYTFMVPNGSGGWDVYYEEIVYRGERLSPPQDTPVGSNGEVFQGWYLDPACTHRFNGFSDALASPVDTTLYASFNAPKKVTYRGYQASGEGELITVQTYAADGSQYLNTLGVGKNYTYKSGTTTYKLIGWSDADPKPVPGTIPASYYSGYTDHPVTSDMTLHPVLEDGFWLIFHQDENMVTIPSVFYARSQNLNFTWPDPDDVTRQDYDFTGKWYTDPACTQEFNWNTTLSADTTIYAKWTPRPNVTSQYTVVWWVEKADSNGSLTDKSNYAYSNSLTVSGIALGTAIPNTVQVTTSHASNTAANDPRHADQVYEGATSRANYFAANSSLTDASTTVVRDGSATLNIYLQRVRYTLQFNVKVGNQNRGKITFNGTDYNTSWTETAWYQMRLAGKWPVDSGNGTTVPKLTMKGNYKYGGWDNSAFSNPTTVPDMVPDEWLSNASGGTVAFNLLGDGPTTQTKIQYRFLNDLTKSAEAAENYENTTYDGRSYDQTVNSTGNFGAKDILGYDHHADFGTNPTPASGDQPRTYTFYYTRQTRNIHLHDASGNVISQSPITLMVGEGLYGKISLPEDYGISTPEGKEFAGWSRSADALVDVYDPEDDSVTMPLYDIHYYLHWKDRQVTVTVVKYDNSEQVYGPLVYGSKLSEFGLQAEERTGYQFQGWKLKNGSALLSMSYQVKDNITVEGYYVSLTAGSLLYDLNGATLKSGETNPIHGTTLEGGLYKDNDQYMIGASVPVKDLDKSKIDLPVNTVDFAYWNTAADGTGDSYYPNDVIEMPEGVDVVLYAIYSPDMSTTLIYDLNYEGKPANKTVYFPDYRATTSPQGQQLDPNQLKVNDIYTVGTEFVSGSYRPLQYDGKTVAELNSGKRFLGWSESQNAYTPDYIDNETKIRVTSYDGETGVYMAEHTLYAVWAICKIVDNDGEHPFPTLNAAVTYARTHNNGTTLTMDADHTVAIQMLVDYEIPSSDKVTLDQANDNITITTAPVQSALPQGHIYAFQADSNFAARTNDDSTSIAILARGWNDGESLFTLDNSCKLITENIIFDGKGADTEGTLTQFTGRAIKANEGKNSALTIDSGSIFRNFIVNDSSGGAVLIGKENNPATIRNTGTGITGFYNCHATGTSQYGQGGAIYFGNGGTMEGVTIDGNGTDDNLPASVTANAVKGAAVYLAAGTLTIKDSEIKDCLASDANGGAINVASDSCVVKFEGSAKVRGNYNTTDTGTNSITNARTEHNMVLEYDTNAVIQTTQNGLASDANIGVYVIGDDNHNNTTSIYDKHGDAGDPFGTYASGGSTNNFDKFVNDRNALTGALGKGTNADYIVWRIDIKIYDGEIFRDFTNVENPKISRDSAFTIQMPVSVSNGKLKFTNSAGTTVTVPAGTTVILRNMDATTPTYYGYTVPSGGVTEIALSSFTRMGGSGAPSGDFTGQFIVDFSKTNGGMPLTNLIDSSNTQDNKLNLGIGSGNDAAAARGAIEMKDPAGFTLAESTEDNDLTEKADVTVTGLTKNSGSQLFANGGRATIWDDREMALVIEKKADSGTDTYPALPPDAKLKVKIGSGTETEYSQNAAGKFIIPLGELKDYSDIEITLASGHFPRAVTEYTLTAKLMVSNSLAEKSPLNGMYNGTAGTAVTTPQELKFKTTAAPMPSIKITTVKPAYHPGDTVTVSIETKNDKLYQVDAVVYKKNGDTTSWASTDTVVSTTTVKSAGTDDNTFNTLTYTIPANLAADASYKVVVKVLAWDETTSEYTVLLLEVPYYFLAVKPD